MLKNSFNKLITFNIFMFFNVMVFLAKIIYNFYNDFSTDYFEDWSIASNLVKYGVYAEFIDVGSTAYKLPIYPLFLSLFIYLFPKNASDVIIVIQHFFYFIIPLIIIFISRILNKEKIGIITSYLFIFSPAYFFYSNVIEATNIFIPILLVWVFFYLKIYKEFYTNNFHYIIFSLITALLFLTQVVIVPVAITLIIYLLISKKIIFKKFIFIVFFLSFFYSPWVIRNYIVFNKFIPTKTPVWQNIFLSFTESVNVIDEVKIIPRRLELQVLGKRAQLPELEMESIYKQKTLKAIEGKEEVFFLKAIQNIALLWYVPPRYFYDHSMKIVFGRKIFVLLLNFFTIISLFYLFKSNRKLFYLSILFFINFTLPYSVGHAANTRFKLDFEWYQYFLVSYLIYYYSKRNHLIT